MFPHTSSISAARLIGVVAACLPTIMSCAQLTPARGYFGVNRPIPMNVSVPDDLVGNISVHLLAPGPNGSADAVMIAKSEVQPGGNDFAGLFPILWSTENPRLLYAQLIVGEQSVGSAVVLQPMVTPQSARIVGRNVQFDDNPQKVYSGLHAYLERHIVFDTTEGEIEVALRPDQAPNTVQSILNLVDGGFYTDIIVHRVVPISPNGHPFVIQFGDPTGSGAGGPGYFTDLEPSTLEHTFGVVSMARTADPHTNGSQVFIGLSREGAAHLDGNYVAFGQTVRGADTIIRIEKTPLESPSSGRPVNPPIVKSAWTIEAPPYGAGPKPVARPAATDGAR